MFKNFNEEQFRTSVASMPELNESLASTNADVSAAILNMGMSRVLDTLAPVCNIQNRKAYVPYLTAATKELQAAARAAQAKAAESGDQEDWRFYRSTRNQKNKSVKDDQLKWEKEKLNSTNDPSDMWKTAKSMLGWTCSGPPTQLYHQGN